LTSAVILPHRSPRSFDYGGVHFVSLDTETDFPDAAENEKGDSGIFDAGHFAPDGECLRAVLKPPG
jgi:hypothetical protein